MSLERKPTLLVVNGPNVKLPPSDKFRVVDHQVDYDNPFRFEVARLRSTLEQYLIRGNSISVAGIGDGGLVSVAAAVENDTWYPSVDGKNAIEIVTFGTRYHPNRFDGVVGGRFTSEGIDWLGSNGIPPSLTERITTVLWEENIFMTENVGTLDGVTKWPILRTSSNGYKRGPSVILEESLDTYFTKK